MGAGEGDACKNQGYARSLFALYSHAEGWTDYFDKAAEDKDQLGSLQMEHILSLLSRRRLVAGFKVLFQLHPPGHDILVRGDDTFLVSYPKSGNTWARFLIANLIHPERSPDFSNIDELIPAPEVISKRRFNQLPSPRVIRTHSSFDPRFKRVIYIVRDPRDIVVSQFHYHRKRKRIDDGCSMEAFVARFLAGETTEDGSWKNNVASWVASRFGDPRFLLLRYEDMLEDVNRELGRIARFLDFPATPNEIAAAAERSSAGQMRKLEQSTGDGCALIKDTRQDLPFVRSAKAGNWKSDLPEQSIAAMEREWGGWMSWLGYEIVSEHVQERWKGRDSKLDHDPLDLLDERSSRYSA